jgi:hypothetical protein
MTKVQYYSHSPNLRRYITRYNYEALGFASKYAGNITIRETPIGKVYEVSF